MKIVMKNNIIFLERKLLSSITMTLYIIFLIISYINDMKVLHLYKYYINKWDFSIKNIFYQNNWNHGVNAFYSPPNIFGEMYGGFFTSRCISRVCHLQPHNLILSPCASTLIFKMIISLIFNAIEQKLFFRDLVKLLKC